MEILTKTLDLEDERDDLKERRDRLQSEIDNRVDRAMGLEDNENGDVAEELRRLDGEVEELEASLILTKGRLKAVNRALQEWEGSEVVVRELTGAEGRKIRTQAQKRAEKMGTEYTDEFHKSLMLQHAIEQTPAGCPDPDNIGDLPEQMFDLLVARANTLNSVGDFEMGNSSLRERMAERREDNQTPTSSNQ
jgi:seryl-tRNA synthetase